MADTTRTPDMLGAPHALSRPEGLSISAESTTPQESRVVLINQETLLAKVSGSLNSGIIVKRFHGVEAISELFKFRVTFFAEDDSVDLDSMLGTNINIAMTSESQERYIDGIITEFSQGATKNGSGGVRSTEYSAIIRPKLWLLTIDKNYLIFQRKSAIDIIKEVLQNNGITDVDDQTSSRGTVEREYCVQYNESSFDFISRLMEDEGIFYFFKHENGRHVLVLADSSGSHENIPKNPEIKFFKGSRGGAFSFGTIFNTNIIASVNTGKYSNADYNYTISQTKLHSELETQWGGQEFYEFPGKYETTEEGENISKVRVEMFEFNRNLFKASSSVPNLTPGFTFQLTDHHFAKFNTEYTVHSIEHLYDASATKEQAYKNSFKAFPKGTEFRPHRKTPKPRIYGTQTAMVVCPSDEEIYRNEHCCVKVHFYWDQIGETADTDDSSCWIRVAQLIAGSAWGAVFIPRVGQEVVVTFIEGDPDRPLIVGTVYNDQFMPPYADTEAMISGIKMATFKDEEGEKFNEIRINDEDEEQEIYVHAQKDMKIRILNSRRTEIVESDDELELEKGNRTISLKAEGDDPANHSLTLTKGDSIVELTEGNHSFTITQGNENITLSDGNRTVTLSKGNEDITLTDGNRTLTLSSGNLSYDVTGDYSLKVSGNLSIEVGGNISIESGGNAAIEAGGTMGIESGRKMDIEAGAALTMESSGNMDITAGRGGNLTAAAAGNFTASASGGCEVALGRGSSSMSAPACEVSLGNGSSSMSAPACSLELGNGQSNLSGPMIDLNGPLITIGGGIVNLG